MNKIPTHHTQNEDPILGRNSIMTQKIWEDYLKTVKDLVNDLGELVDGEDVRPTLETILNTLDKHKTSLTSLSSADTECQRLLEKIEELSQSQLPLRDTIGRLRRTMQEKQRTHDKRAETLKTELDQAQARHASAIQALNQELEHAQMENASKIDTLNQALIRAQSENTQNLLDSGSVLRRTLHDHMVKARESEATLEKTLAGNALQTTQSLDKLQHARSEHANRIQQLRDDYAEENRKLTDEIKAKSDRADSLRRLMDSYDSQLGQRHAHEVDIRRIDAQNPVHKDFLHALCSGLGIQPPDQGLPLPSLAYLLIKAADQIRQDITSIKEKSNNTQSELDASQVELVISKAQAQTLRQENLDLKAGNESLTTRNQSQGRSLVDATTRSSELSSQVTTLQTRLRGLEQSLDAAHQASGNLQMDLTSKDQCVTNHANAETELRRQLSEAGNQRADEVREAINKVAELERNKARLEKDLSASSSSRDRWQDQQSKEIGRLRESNRLLEASAGKHQHDLKKQQNKSDLENLESLRHLGHTHSLEIQKKDSDIEILQDEVRYFRLSLQTREFTPSERRSNQEEDRHTSRAVSPELISDAIHGHVEIPESEIGVRGSGAYGSGFYSLLRQETQGDAETSSVPPIEPRNQNTKRSAAAAGLPANTFPVARFGTSKGIPAENPSFHEPYPEALKEAAAGCQRVNVELGPDGVWTLDDGVSEALRDRLVGLSRYVHDKNREPTYGNFPKHAARYRRQCLFCFGRRHQPVDQGCRWALEDPSDPAASPCDQYHSCAACSSKGYPCVMVLNATEILVLPRA